MTQGAAVSAAMLASVIVALALAACSSGAGSPSVPASVPAATAAPPASAAPTSVASAANAVSSPAATTFGSPAYRYRMPVPASLLAGAQVLASAPWDGTVQLDSDGPYTDKAYLVGNRLLFVYGAPTELDLKGYATDIQTKKADWHGCTEAPDKITETTFDGEPALLYSFPCGGNHMQSLYAMHDGFALVVNLLSPPTDKAANAAAFGEILSGGEWTD